MLSFVLERGGDVNVRDEAGCTALHHAVYYQWGEAVRDLLHRGANPNIKTKASYKDFPEATPLHIACQVADMGILETLIGAEGIDMEAKDGDGDTPLNSLMHGQESKTWKDENPNPNHNPKPNPNPHPDLSP